MKYIYKKYLYLILLIIIIYIIYQYTYIPSYEMFTNKTINLYNEYHLGDCIFVMVYLNNSKQYILDNNININFYINKQYIEQVSEFIPCDNVKIYNIEEKPQSARDTWIKSLNKFSFEDIQTTESTLVRYVDSKKMSFENYLITFLSEIGMLVGLPPINEFSYEDEDLLIRYNQLDNKYKDIDILILNSTPKSGQYTYNKDEWNKLIINLNSQYKIITTEKVDTILCSADNKLTIKDIAAVSTHVQYIIAVNSGPIVALFNKYTLKNVKKWYVFDNNLFYSLNNFSQNMSLPDIESELMK